MLLGDSSSNVQMDLKYAGYNIPPKQLRVPSATRSPETARRRRVPPTQQPSPSPAKERASKPNSASDDFSNLLSRRRQVITTFPFGSAVERLILDKQGVSSNPPVSAFLLFFLLFFLLYVSSNPPVCFLFLYFSAVLLYVQVLLLYCTHMVGSWVVVGG